MKSIALIFKLSQWLDKILTYAIIGFFLGIFKLLELSYKATKQLPEWCSLAIPGFIAGSFTFLVCTLFCLFITGDIIASLYLGILQGICAIALTYALALICFHLRGD